MLRSLEVELLQGCGRVRHAARQSYPMLVRCLQERFETTAYAEGRRPVLLLHENHKCRPDRLGLLRIFTSFT